jgi:hypothetical protein
MSFALTTEQIRAKTKTVTRRLGWEFLRPGDRVQPVVKCQGLKKGQKGERIGKPITVVSVCRTSLCSIIVFYKISQKECAREGFPDMSPEEFVEIFCRVNKCKRETQVTRIEFEYEKEEEK